MTNEELVQKIQETGDQDLILKLWDQMKRFVRAIARKYVPFLRCKSGDRDKEDEDLLQEGFIAITQAVKDYDPEAGMSFSSYAAFFLHRVFSDHVATMIGTSRGQTFQLRMMKRFVSEYQELTGRTPSDNMICDSLGITEERLQTIRRIGSSSLSIDSSGDEEDDRTLLDRIASPENIEDEVIDQIVGDQVRVLLDQYVRDLPDLQRQIIRLSFYEGFPETRVADYLHIGRSKLRNEKLKAIRSIGRSRHLEELGRLLPERVGSMAYHGADRNRWRSSTEKTAIYLVEGFHDIQSI